MKPIRIFQTVSLGNRVNKMVDSLLRGGLEVVMNFMNSHRSGFLMLTAEELA